LETVKLNAQRDLEHNGCEAGRAGWAVRTAVLSCKPPRDGSIMPGRDGGCRCGVLSVGRCGATVEGCLPMGRKPDSREESAAQERFLGSLAEAIEAEGLLPPEGRVVVGVSGGADSMALLYGLVALNERLQKRWTLHVAHLHHGIRGRDADEDARFVESVCKEMALPFFLERVDVPAVAKERKQSLEEAARQVRYEFFERVCLQTDSRYLALGHHADDNAETVLHRILRGTGIRGLAGILPARPLRPGSDITVVRPLLRFRRQEIREYLQSIGAAWREDHTNAEVSLTRNRLRHEVLPLIESKVNRQVVPALLRLAEQARWVDAYLRETAERTLQTLIISRTDCELAINLPALLKRRRVIQTELIRQALLLLGVGEQQIGYEHILSVLRLAEQAASGKRLNLPGRVTVTKRYDKLIFSLPTGRVADDGFCDVAVRLPGTTVLPRRGIALEAEIQPFEPELLEKVRQKNDPWTEYLDYDQVCPPLVVRSRRPGDRFWPLGAPGSKKLSDFFIERKVEPDQRDRICLLCDQLGPIWVVGMRIDERVRLRRNTCTVLRLTARPLEAER